jgi:PPK2 family polyphosphate:nucleotide phosphotransferase
VKTRIEVDRVEEVRSIPLKRVLRVAHDLSDRYRVTDGRKFRLRNFDPADTGRLTDESKADAQTALRTGVQALADLQQMLYATNQWGLLLIFQAMDAAGKDSAIKHVMSGINPQGCQVFTFKQPSDEELDHDYMWRCYRSLPERGRIGIFNRSYYEEVLVVRVHRELLERQRIPRELIGKKIWDQRCADIRGFEDYLSRNGFVIRKFFLNVSYAEQRRRFLERLDNPEKHWKFSSADVREREHWNEYMTAYEMMIRKTASKAAPWYVVPADKKWYTRLIVAAAAIDAMAELNLAYPQVGAKKMRQLAGARKILLGERSRPD